MIPTAELSHGLPGRSRIRVRSKRGDPDYFLQVGQELEKLSAVYAVQVNDRTGSILITHEEEALEQIAAHAQLAELFLLDSVHYEPKPVLQKAATGLVNLDSSWSGMTSGHFDFRSILYVCGASRYSDCSDNARADFGASHHAALVCHGFAQVHRR